MKNKIWIILAIIAVVLLLPKEEKKTGSISEMYKATDDTFTDAANPNMEFSSDNYLRLGYEAKTPDNYRIYLKFDLSSLPTTAFINSAYLTLWATGPQGSNPLVNWWAISDTSWQGNTVTWNNQPPFDIQAPHGTDCIFIANTYCRWDITSFIKTSLSMCEPGACINKIYPFVLLSTNNEIATFHSTNWGSTYPFIEISYTTYTPEYSNFILSKSTFLSGASTFSDFITNANSWVTG